MKLAIHALIRITVPIAHPHKNACFDSEVNKWKREKETGKSFRTGVCSSLERGEQVSFVQQNTTV
jgi:hypothetical protein